MKTRMDEQAALLPTEKDVAFYEEHGWYISKKIIPDEVLDEAIAHPRAPGAASAGCPHDPSVAPQPAVQSARAGPLAHRGCAHVAGWRVFHIQPGTARPHRRTPFLRVRGRNARYPALPSPVDS